MNSASKVFGIIAAAVVAVGLAACSMPGTGARPVAARPASATDVPVRVQPNAVGWSLAWRNWGGPQARATGKLDIYWPQPGPIAGWHPTTYTVTVRLQDIVSHNGQPAYRKMADFYINRRGDATVLYFKFGVLPGGSVPGWNPSGARLPGL